MEIAKLCAAAIIAAVLNLIIRRTLPEFAPLVSIASCLVLAYIAISSLVPTVEYLFDFSNSVSPEYSGYFTVMLKALGIFLAVQTAADICRDMGEAATAQKLELAGKAELLILALPLIKELTSIGLSLAG